MGNIVLKKELSKLSPREKLILSFSGVGMVSCVIMGITFFGMGIREVGVIATIVGTAYSLPGLMYYKFRSIEHATYLLTTITGVVIGAIAYLSPVSRGILGDGLNFLILLPLAGGLLADKSGLFVGVITQVTVLIFACYEDWMFFQTNPIEAGYWIRAIEVVLVHFIVPGVVLLFARVQTWILETKTQKIDTLLKIVTHDVANPLTVIHGMSEALLNFGELEPKAASILKKINKSSNDIRDILERVKNIQVMKSNQLKVNLGPVSLKEIFSQVQETFETRLHVKGLKINSTIEGMEDIIIIAEKTTFRNDVINNLMSNAIKFSNSGDEILMTARVDGSTAKIMVEDRGIGMSKSLMVKAFDDFKETSRLGTEGEEGTGFGLPIVKYLMASYNGDVAVSSKTIEENPIDHGTCFTLTLDLDRAIPHQKSA